VDLFLAQRRRAQLVVGPARVAAVDDRVVRREQLGELIDRRLRRLAGRDHDPHGARGRELFDEILECRGAARAALLSPRDRLRIEVERDDLVFGVPPDPRDHVAAHLAEAD
jgi:hypothetical protein